MKQWFYRMFYVKIIKKIPPETFDEICNYIIIVFVIVNKK